MKSWDSRDRKVNQVISLMWWGSLDLQDPRVLQELRDTPDQEALKADGVSQGLQDLMGSLVCQEIQESLEPQDNPHTLGATWCHRCLQVLVRSLVWLGWYQDQGVRQDHEDLQDSLGHRAQVVVREFQERLEKQDKWVSRVTADQTGHQEKLDLMENLDLQVLQESQDFQDLWVQEDSQDFQVIQD